MQKTPAVVEAFFVRLTKAQGGRAADHYVRELGKAFVNPQDVEFRGA